MENKAFIPDIQRNLGTHHYRIITSTISPMEFNAAPSIRIDIPTTTRTSRIIRNVLLLPSLSVIL
ncbi:hypothetical protein [Methanosarcina sp. WH1]|uniref:hypothetical protein n=1 Tax=Methanosarcina sp. WH1 TaxID=1434102 RepID=UPI0012E02F63|nr:hypothetical protein [Methanosarcina sp. WH1]